MSAPPVPEQDAPERAVLFTDVVSSTEIVSRCGDGDWLRQLDRHTRAMAVIVARSGGSLGNFLGDGMMFHFDRPADAVIAALRMRTATDVQGFFELRMGIAHGRVLPFGERWHVGLTLHLASRLTDRCAPGEIVLSDACYRAARPAAAIPPVRTSVVAIPGFDHLQTVHTIERDGRS